MKHLFIRLLLFLILSAFTPSAHGGWFGSSRKEKEEHKQQVVKLEQDLQHAHQKTDTWIIAAAFLSLLCVLLLILGTALGAKVRRHHESHS